MFCPFSNVEVDPSHCGPHAPNQASTEQVAWGTWGKRKQWSIGTPLCYPGNNHYLVFLDLTWLTDVHNSARTSSEQIPCNETPTSLGVTGEMTILKSAPRVSRQRDGIHQDAATWSGCVVPEEKMRTWRWRMALWHRMHQRVPGATNGFSWGRMRIALMVSQGPLQAGLFLFDFSCFCFFFFTKNDHQIPIILCMQHPLNLSDSLRQRKHQV